MADSVWKALHWQPPTPQRGLEGPGADHVPRPPAAIYPEDPPATDRYPQSRAQIRELYETPQRIIHTQGQKLDPLSEAPPSGIRPLNFPAVDRPNQIHLDPVQAGVAGVSKELIARLQSRMSTLEMRTASVEEAASQAVHGTKPAVERMEDRIAKMTGSLSQAEAEVSALRRAVVEQEHQRRTLESRLLEAAEASNAARSELQEQRQWLEQSGRDADVIKSQMRQLEGALSRDSNSAVQEQEVKRQQQELRLREEAQRRESSMSQQMAAMKQEMDGLRNALAASRSESVSAFQQLSSRMDGSDRQLGDLVHSRKESSSTFPGIQQEMAELRSAVGKVQSSVLEADRQLRKEEQKAALTSSELEGKIAAAEANILKQTAGLVENRTRDMQRRWNELEDSIYERLNSRMSEESDKLSHVAKSATRDKQHQQERVADLERHVNALSGRQDEGDESTRRMMKKTRDDFMALATHNKTQLEEMAGRLQEQTAEALSTLRSYTRDMEEEQERSRLGLEGVVRMEIKSRMSSTNKLKDSVNKVKAEMRSEMKSFKGESEERLGQLEQKLEVLLSAERKLYSRQTELETVNGDQLNALEAKVNGMKEEIEELSVNQVLNESVLKEDVKAELDSGLDALSDTLGKEIRLEIQAVQESMESSLTQALESVDEDVVGVHQDLQKQLTELSQTRAEDVAMIQEVAEKAMKRCDEAEALAATIQQELDEVTAAVTAAMESQAGDLAQLEKVQDENMTARLSALEKELSKIHAGLIQAQEGAADSVSEIDALRKELDDQFAAAKAQVETAHEVLKVQVDAKYDAQSASWLEELKAVENKLDDALAAVDEAAREHEEEMQALPETAPPDVSPDLADRVAGLEVDLVLAAELNRTETAALSDAMVALSGAFSEVDSRMAETADQLRWQLDEVQRGALSRSEVTQKSTEGLWLQELKRLDARLDSLTGTLTEARTTQLVELSVVKDDIHRVEQKTGKEIAELQKRQGDLLDAGILMEERFDALEGAKTDGAPGERIQKLEENLVETQEQMESLISMVAATDEVAHGAQERAEGLELKVQDLEAEVQDAVVNQVLDEAVQDNEEGESLQIPVGADLADVDTRKLLEHMESVRQETKASQKRLQEKIEACQQDTAALGKESESLVEWVEGIQKDAKQAEEDLSAKLEELSDKLQAGKPIEARKEPLVDFVEGVRKEAKEADDALSAKVATSDEAVDAVERRLAEAETKLQEITSKLGARGSGESGTEQDPNAESLVEWVEGIWKEAKTAEESLIAKIASAGERLDTLEEKLRGDRLASSGDADEQVALQALPNNDKETIVEWVEGIWKEAKAAEEALAAKITSTEELAQASQKEIQDLTAKLESGAVAVPDAVPADIAAHEKESLILWVEGIWKDARDVAVQEKESLVEWVEGIWKEAKTVEESLVAKVASTDERLDTLEEKLRGASLTDSEVSGESAAVQALPNNDKETIMEWVEGIWKEAKAAEEALAAKITSTEELAQASQKEIQDLVAKLETGTLSVSGAVPAADTSAHEKESLVEWVEGIWKEAKAAEETLAARVASTEELAQASQRVIEDLAGKLEAGALSKQESGPADTASHEKESLVEWVEGIWKEAKTAEETLIAKIASTDERLGAVEEKLSGASLADAEVSGVQAPSPALPKTDTEPIVEWVEGIWKEAKAAEEALTAKIASTDAIAQASQKEIQDLAAKLEAGALTLQEAVPADIAAHEKESLIEWVEGIWKEAKTAEEALVAKVTATDRIAQTAQERIQALEAKIEAVKIAPQSEAPLAGDAKSESSVAENATTSLVEEIRKEAKAAEEALIAKVTVTEELVETSHRRIQDLAEKLEAGALASHESVPAEVAALEKESLVEWVEGIWKEAKSAEEALVAKIASTDAAVQDAVTSVGDLRKRVEVHQEQLASMKGESDHLLNAFVSSPRESQTEISPSDMLEAIDEVREAVLQVKSTAVTTQELQQQVKDALAASSGGADAIGGTSHLAESDMKTVKETILEQEAMLLKHEEMLGRSSLQPEDVQQLVVETMNAEKVVSHSQVLELVDDVREEIMAEMDKNQELQSEMLSEMVETLRGYEDRLLTVEDTGEAMEDLLHGSGLHNDGASDGASLGYGLDAASDGASLAPQAELLEDDEAQHSGEDHAAHTEEQQREVVEDAQ